MICPRRWRQPEAPNEPTGGRIPKEAQSRKSSESEDEQKVEKPKRSKKKIDRLTSPTPSKKKSKK